LLIASAVWAAAEEAAPAPPSPETAEVRIGLPPGGAQSVSVTFAAGGLLVDLPREASIPFDLEREGGGVIRKGTLTSISESRVRLSISLVTGGLDEIRYEPDAVVFKLARRHVAIASSGSQDPARSYKLGNDDKIQVSVDGQPDLMRQLVVGPN